VLRVHARGFGRPAPIPLDLPDETCAPHALAPAGRCDPPHGRRAPPRSGDARARGRSCAGGRTRWSSPAARSRRVVASTDLPLVPSTGVVVIEDLEEGDYTLVVSAGREYGTVAVSSACARARCATRRSPWGPPDARAGHGGRLDPPSRTPHRRSRRKVPCTTRKPSSCSGWRQGRARVREPGRRSSRAWSGTSAGSERSGTSRRTARRRCW